MKKRVLAILMCAVMAFSLAACGSSSSSDDSSDSSSDTTTDESEDEDTEEAESTDVSDLAGTTITIMCSQDWVEDAEQELGAQFEEEYGITVDYQIYPADQYEDVLLTMLNAGEGPDIFGLQSGFAIDTTYNVTENAVDLSDEEWMAYYDTFASEQTSVDGVNYGLTYYDVTTDYYMVYNKTLFEEAGITEIPTTYDELCEACEALLAIGVTPIYEPVADGWHQTMLWTENGQVFEFLEEGIIDALNNNETTFAENENMLTALEQINNLAQSGYFGDNYASDEFANAEAYLASGEFAMCMLKPGAISSIVESAYNEAGYTEDDFGLMLLPILDNQYLNSHPTGPSRFIYSGSDNIEAAKLYLSYLVEQDNVQYLIDNASDVENLPIDVGQTAEYSDTTLEFLDQFDDDTTGMVLQDVVLYFNEQWTEISNNIAEMFAGSMTAEEVLEAIDTGRAQLAEAAGDENW